MKLTRRNVLLIGAVLLLAGAELGLRSPARESGARGRLLPDLVAENIAALRLERAGERLDLERAEDGWRVVQKDRFPAHQELVAELLARLVGVSRTDRVSSAAGSREVYGLDGEAVRVELLEDHGAAGVVLWVGRPPELEQGAYVRLDGEDEVYRAATLPALETDPIRWLDTLLIDLDPTLVQSIRVEFSGEGVLEKRPPIELTRLADGRWRAPGHSVLLTSQTVDPLLLMGSNLYFVDLAARAEDLPDSPATRIVFDLEGGGRREVRLGLEDATGNVSATNPYWNEPWQALLSGSTAARLELALGLIERELR